ncbi:MAG: small multidrug resistance protein [Pleurocapsa sp. SU_5_0]|nr:small multidrug resistance protein [Pleurocapsa sp. SU_5_0]NJO98408.1 small multidrug resistance protein [Pleurocapsa sp. CRU_1_2]NJR47903.1 small multidrug resistance protein [Hyellaceae cyanobacterium CSU_1_1]
MLCKFEVRKMGVTQSIWYAWILLGLSAIGTCAGNLLLKQANLALPNSSVLTVIASFWFWGAIACYIFDLILFTQALQHLPVSYAVPVVSGIRIAATAILAYVFFGEHLTLNQFFASGVIIAGIIIMSRT